MFQQRFAFCSLADLPSDPVGRAMEIFDWLDRRDANVPRALIQQGRCEQNQCGQFSISISNGQRGMTIRFESEAEFRQFLERGEAEKR